MKQLVLMISILFFSPLFAVAEGPCKADRENLCSGVEAGEGRIAKCMKENESKLSEGCRSWREARKGHMKGVKAACEDDVEKVCGDVKAGQGAIMKCLKENRDKVSEGCKAEFAKVKEGRKKAKN